MKKVCCLLLSCLLIATMATGASAVVYGKNGYEYYGYSESTAWEINSAAVLERVRDDINSGKIYYEAYFKLTNDIDLTGEQYMDWIPIGGNQVSELAEPENPFDGHFDGNGHTIKMNISKVVTNIDTVYHGLFGTILGGTVKNLSVSGNIEVYTRTIARKMYVGGIAANLIDGSIENCNFDGKIVASNQGDSSNEAYVGGIVSCAGLNYYIFNIKDCKIGSKSATTITATSKSFKDWGIAGGVVGRLDDNSYRGEYSTVTGNWVKATLKAGETGYVYGQRGRAGGRVYNNTEVDPNFVPPLTLTGTFGSGVKGAAYSGSATVSGGTAPYTWKYSGVPDGLKVTISGTSKNKITLSNKPTKAQSYSFKVTATDKNGVAATKTFTIKVTQPASKLAFSGSFTDGFVDEYYSRTLKVSGGTEPYTWSKTGTGTWPTGLKLSKTSTGATLKLYGTPSKAGKYKFTLAVTDSKGVSASKTFTINISEEEFEDIDFSVASAKSFSIKKVLNGANSFLYNSVVEETPNAEQEAARSFSVANTILKVLSDDILKQGEGRDEDLVDVRANEPVRFMIGEWLDANGAKAEVSSEDVYIYIDDKPVEDIIVSDEGLFTVPADFVHDDFKVQAIAETATKRLETVELFVSAIE